MHRVLVIGRGDHAAEFVSTLNGCDATLRDPAAAPLAIGDAEGVDTIVDLTLGSAADHATFATMFRGLPLIKQVAITALSSSATEAAGAWGPVPIVSLGWLPGLSPAAESIELSAALQLLPDDARTIARAFEARLGKRVELVADRVGLVSARILAMIVNEAAFAVMEGVASPADIDTAMRLGTNYPAGPLEWADTIGADTIVHLLDALHRDYRDERYRACILLRQHARAGRPFRSHLSSPI